MADSDDEKRMNRDGADEDRIEISLPKPDSDQDGPVSVSLPKVPLEEGDEEEDVPQFFSIPSVSSESPPPPPPASASDSVQTSQEPAPFPVPPAGSPPLPPGRLPAMQTGLDEDVYDPNAAPMEKTPGQQLGMWSIICCLLGSVGFFLPRVGAMLFLCFFGLGFILALASFFGKPKVPLSIAALLFSVLAPPCFVLLGLFVLGMQFFGAVSEKQMVTVQEGFEALNGELADLEKSGMLRDQSFDSVRQELDPDVPPLPDFASVPEDVDPTLSLPPEERPREEPEVLEEVAESVSSLVIPPEERRRVSTLRNRTLRSLLMTLNSGMDVNASAYDRELALRLSNQLGYPLETISRLDDDMRLYLISQLVEDMDFSTLELPSMLRDEQEEANVYQEGFSGGRAGNKGDVTSRRKAAQPDSDGFVAPSF